MQVLLNLPKEIVTIIAIALAVLICAMHFAAVLSKQTLAKIAQYTNIFLHIILFCYLLISQADISIGVAAFMASLFTYTFISYAKHTIGRRKAESSNVKEDEDHDI